MRLNPIIIHTAAAYCGPATTRSDLEERAATLELLDQFLREKQENIWREDSVYESEIQPGIALWQLLYEDHTDYSDLRRILSPILDRAKTFDTPLGSTQPPTAGIGLWRAGDRFLEHQNDWYEFRRETLFECGVTPASFCEQAELIFPHFSLSSRFPACLETLEGGFARFLPTVIAALTELHDKLRQALGNHNIVEGLRNFTALSGFETTMEGTADRNEALTFSFNDNGKEKRLVCAPHMKLASSNVPGDSKHYYNRIYFNPYQENPNSLRIHIGHVGQHL